MNRLVRTLVIFLALIGLGFGVFRFTTFEYAYTPPNEKIVNKNQGSAKVQSISSDEEAGSDEQIQLGKQMFFEESFGNEVFFTDILGLFDGALTIPNISKAILRLKGEGTSNLKVEAAQSFQAGNRSIKKGELISTGLDVAKGSILPLGIKFVVDQGRVKAGVSCAACHATVDDNGKVLPGVPNSDVDVGLALAMGTNTAGYFTHTEMKSIKDFIIKTKENTENTQKISLPDKEKLEKYVDAELVKWPKGSNDTTIDFNNDPVQIPDSFTLGDHPYGWSGQGQIGPFTGLSAAINNAHGQNMDTLSQTEISEPVLNIDKELYIGTILQNAANKKFRYDPNSNQKPSKFFESVDPTPGNPGVNTLVKAVTFPKISFTTSTGMLPSSEGYKVWEQLNAISAYMNSLKTPQTGLERDDAVYAEGQRIFSRAGCITCHSGEYYTKNSLVKVEEIGTEPSRAGGFKKTELYFADPKLYSSETPVPIPKNPKVKKIPLSEQQRKSLELGWAHGKNKGAYKIPSLYGLYWSAPYLHDGGVAIGENFEVGIPNTLMKNKKADPYNSLQALIDSDIRKMVIQANQSAEETSTAHVSGIGHEFWVDESTGFTDAEQSALIHFLLRLTDQK
ncbi:electron transport protein [Neobacillus sp. LXY-4]|uniref:electron transport protein n=1 Tax=Neobacillus sp. LXY-4 TaxID=3379826 RepID=UPI003EE1D74D